MNDKEQYDLDTLRHSCAHLMAQAVKQLYPETQERPEPAEKIPEAIKSFTQAQAIFATLHYQMGYDHMTNVLHRLDTISNAKQGR